MQLSERLPENTKINKYAINAMGFSKMKADSTSVELMDAQGSGEAQGKVIGHATPASMSCSGVVL